MPSGVFRSSKDKAGRDWKGGLFKPVPYEAGRRYPLVIQTHGFTDTEFRPSGIFPTAFAARALAGAGLIVLQVNDCPYSVTPEEGPCNVRGYEAAVNELVNAGLVDPDRVGIVGFSRTCFYVLETLTTSALHIKAASITDGAMENYLQYMTAVDESENELANEYDAMVGARPFAAGLQLWLKRSPVFNVDKVNAALQVVALGRASLTEMWEPYAAMRYLHKPVDLILLNNNEHVLSNPGARLVSQGGTVDWFRFWLQDYEDPDPAKVEQYQRWRELRKLQVAQDAELAKTEKKASSKPRRRMRRHKLTVDDADVLGISLLVPR
jgi:dipeptidyl aminopeptidase/acylaminoacyl peptidase